MRLVGSMSSNRSMCGHCGDKNRGDLWSALQSFFLYIYTTTSGVDIREKSNSSVCHEVFMRCGYVDSGVDSMCIS